MILLINPAVRPDSPKCILNVGLAYIATALERAGLDFQILDIDAHRPSNQEIECELRRRKYDAVGIGTLVSQYGWVKWIAGVVEESHPGVPIVAGNTVATSVPDTLLRCTAVDVAVLGEGDETAVEVFEHLAAAAPLDEVSGIAYMRDGQVVRTPPRPVIADISAIPSPNYDLFDMDIYLDKSKWMVPSPDRLPIPFDEIVSMPVNTARGCAFSCTFCFHAFQHLKYRYRTPESIADEIQLWKDKYGVNHISFWDELSFYHPKATERFADLMLTRNLGVHFTASCRSELLNWDNYHVAEKLHRAGCKGLGFALESGDEGILTAMNKKNHVANFVEQAQVCHAAGIEVYTSLVFGYPEETRETIRETFRVCQEANVYPSVGYLQPMPGTPMYELAQETGAIPDEEKYLLRMGDRQDLRVALTKHLTGEQMEQAVHDELVALNATLETGLGEDELIKTRAYRVPKRETFLESFGQAAKIREASAA